LRDGAGVFRMKVKVGNDLGHGIYFIPPGLRYQNRYFRLLWKAEAPPMFGI
jgi:hypothetical protein